MSDSPSNYYRAPITQYYTRPIPFWAKCFPAVFVTFLILIPIESLIFYGQVSLPWVAVNLAESCLAVMLFILPAVVVFGHLFSTTVSEQGLRSYNGVGKYSVIPWDSIQQLSNLNLIGLKYLRFKTDGMILAALVPFDLDRPSQFADEVSRYLGSDHPTVANLKRSWKLKESPTTG